MLFEQNRASKHVSQGSPTRESGVAIRKIRMWIATPRLYYKKSPHFNLTTLLATRFGQLG